MIEPNLKDFPEGILEIAKSQKKGEWTTQMHNASGNRNKTKEIS